MHRRKPTTVLDVFGNLNLNPEKRTDFFVRSKQETKTFSKPPSWDSAGDSIELLASENDIEHKTMLHLQKEMLKDKKAQSAVNRDRIKEVYESQLQLRKYFVEVNIKLKDYHDKKCKAEAIVAREKARHDELKEAIRKYENDIVVLKKFRDALINTVKDLEPYEKIMEEVVVESDHFTSIKDCMERCDALMLVQTDVTQMKETKLQEIEIKRQKMSNAAKEAALTIMGYLNELTKLERDFYQAHSDCLKWEKILANVKDCMIETSMTKTIIKDGIQLLYRQLCVRRGLIPVTVGIEKQLDFLKEEIQVLQNVVRECTKE